MKEILTTIMVPPGKPGKRLVLIQHYTEDSVIACRVHLTPAAARGVANALLQKAKEAESILVAPTADMTIENPTKGNDA